MVINSIRSGLFGRIIITIGAAHGTTIQNYDFGHGDPIVVRSKGAQHSGFIFSVAELEIDICMDRINFSIFL